MSRALPLTLAVANTLASVSLYSHSVFAAATTPASPIASAAPDQSMPSRAASHVSSAPGRSETLVATGAANAETAYWAAPESLIVAEDWVHGGPIRSIDGTSPIELKKTQLLFVALERGDWVEALVEPGHSPVQLGFATGSGSVPDTIVWDNSGLTQLQLPTWSKARSIAVRAAVDTALVVHLSARPATPAEWFLWDGAIANWARAGTPLPLPTSSDARRVVRVLERIRLGLPEQERSRAAPLLLAFWFEQSLRTRPLSGPFLTTTTPRDAIQPRVMVGPSRLRFDSVGADLHRWQLRARGPARVIIREGNGIARVLAWPAPSTRTKDWSPLQKVRSIAAADGTAAELQVLEGTISVAMQSATLRPEYRELFGPARRQRKALMAESDRLDAASSFGPQPGQIKQHRCASARQAPAANSAAELAAYVCLAASKDADSLDQAIADALSGLSIAADDNWRTLFAERLLDLAVDDVPPNPLRTPAPQIIGGTIAPSLATSAATSPAQPWQRLTRSDSQSSIATGSGVGVTGQEILLRGLAQTLAPSKLSRRPPMGEAIEAYALANAADATPKRVAAKYWEAYPYRNVTGPLGERTSSALVPIDRDGTCNPQQEGLEAWIVPAAGATDLELELPPDLYAVATLRPLDEAPQPEGLVHIDAVPITVHAGAGLSSRVALGPGRHRIQRQLGSPRVAIEATPGMVLPCRQLYRWQHFTQLQPDRSVRFELPAPGTASVAKLRFAQPTAFAQAWVKLGERRFEVTTRNPEAGSAELLIKRDDDALEVTAQVPLAIAVAMRRESDPPSVPLELPLTSMASATGAEASSPPSPSLARLAALGRQLRSERDVVNAGRLRQERGQLLFRAGSSTLALRDIVALPVPENTDLVHIEGANAPVIPLGLPATIAPLALPRDARRLLERRRANRDGGAAACALGIDELDQSAPDAETLLAADCAERIGLTATAADLFERIARATRQGVPMLHAAGLVADVAVASQDKRLSLNAAILGNWASLWGTDASNLRARLTTAIEWVTPPLFDGAAGIVWLARGRADPPSPRESLLTHLTDAAPTALVIDEHELAELRVKTDGSVPLVVASQCDAAMGTDGCKLNAWVDDQPVLCTGANADKHCQLPVAAGKHRIRLGFDGTRAIGWVEARLGEQTLRPFLTSEWSVLDAAVPVRIAIKGPTLLRIQARVRGSGGGSIALRGCELASDYAELRLPSQRDPQVRPWPEVEPAAPIGMALDLSVPIPHDRRCSLTLEARQGDTLARISLARPKGLPTARLSSSRSVELSPPAALRSTREAESLTESAAPQALDDRYPLLLGARSRFVSESLSVALEQDSSSSDGAFQDLFGEVSALASRELVMNRWWGTLQAGARLRNGPTTEFARISLDMPPQLALPGVDLIGTVYSQSVAGTRITTVSTTGRLSRIWRASPSVAFAPQLGFTTLRLGTAPGLGAGLDGDVYSNFYATHPRYASAAAAVMLRPYVDSLINLSISTRSLPRLDGIDRLTASAELMILPVPTWPLLGGLDWMSSYRPASALRDAGFVRHDFGVAWSLWHWITPSERLRWFGRVDFFFDAPAAKLGSVIVAPTIGLEVTSSGARGLRDLSPQQAPLREFQERGSARIRTGRVGEIDDAAMTGAGP